MYSGRLILTLSYKEGTFVSGNNLIKTRKDCYYLNMADTYRVHCTIHLVLHLYVHALCKIITVHDTCFPLSTGPGVYVF